MKKVNKIMFNRRKILHPLNSIIKLIDYDIKYGPTREQDLVVIIGFVETLYDQVKEFRMYTFLQKPARKCFFK